MINKKIKYLFLTIFIIVISLGNLFASNFYYDSLGYIEKNLYNEIKTSLMNFDVSLGDVGEDFERISDIYYFVLFDNPQLFYVSNKLDYSTTTQGDKLISSKLIFNYKYNNQNNLDYVNNELFTLKNNFKNQVKGFSDFEIVKYCFEYLINNSYYDKNYPDQTLVSVLLDNVGLCSSYAKSYKYLMDYFDIPCLLVEGTFINSSENHVWNMVMLDNSWYHVDVTQGDASNSYVDYSYLCVSEYQILKDHIIESKIPLFSATSNKYNYLNRVGCFFYYFDKGNIENCIRASINNESSEIIIGFDNHINYSKAKTYLIENEGFYEILLKNGYEISALNYSTNDLTDVLIFILDKDLIKKDIIYFKLYSSDILKKEISRRYKSGKTEFYLLFDNKINLDQAKKYLIEDQNIFKIIEGNKSLSIKYYDDINRFDIEI